MLEVLEDGSRLVTNSALDQVSSRVTGNGARAVYSRGSLDGVRLSQRLKEQPGQLGENFLSPETRLFIH